MSTIINFRNISHSSVLKDDNTLLILVYLHYYKPKQDYNKSNTVRLANYRSNITLNSLHKLQCSETIN